MKDILKRSDLKGLVLLLFSRLFLFAFFQALIAMALISWADSEKYWLLTATLANIVSIILLKIQFKNEKIKYLTLFRFSKKQRVKDFIIFLALALISMPMILIPSLLLSQLFWVNTTYYHQVLFQTIPVSINYLLLFALPVTMALAEVPTYFGYIMPRLKNSARLGWSALILPIVFLSIQNCTLPLVFEAKFIIFRSLMYLPFAIVLGISLYKRSSLLPYISILYGMVYALPVIMLLTHKSY